MPPRPASTPPAAQQAPPPLVRTVAGRRTLEFLPGDVQSEMLLARPHALTLAYARAMMCFALFAPRPRHIVMVGLGGGSLVKFCHRHLPHTRITVIELRADVIALREQFCVPPDDERLTVVHADAAGYIAALHGCADVLLVDGFDEHGLPGALSSARFYAHCRQALADGGLLAANIFSYDPAHDTVLARIRQAFDGRVCWFDGVAGNNHIFFALKASRAALAQPGCARRERLFRLVGHGRGFRARWLNWLFARMLVALLARRG